MPLLRRAVLFYQAKVCRGFIYIGCTDSPNLRKVKAGNIGEAPPITDSRKGCPYEWSAMDISENSCRLRSSGASGSPHPTNCAPINHANSRANNIRPHCICFIYCFEQNKTNPSVYASRIRLPYREAKIDSATNLNLSIRFMYAQRYINVFYHDIIHRKNFPPPCSKISNPCVLYFTRFV